MKAGEILRNMLGRKPDLDEKSVHDRILDLESRSLWIDLELGSKENQSLETCAYSKDMLESLEDERNLLLLLANVMYRREKLLKERKTLLV
jgi:hypothetical protein